MKLRFGFMPIERERLRLTKNDIYHLSSTAMAIEAISEVMANYACDNTEQKEQSSVIVNCMHAFNVLNLLIDPIVDYLSEYAGEEAAPDEPKQTEAKEPKENKNEG